MVQCTVYRTRAFTSMSSQDLHNNPVELGTEIISSTGGGRREGHHRRGVGGFQSKVERSWPAPYQRTKPF